MSMIKWFFMSKYQKLLYQIKCAETNEQRLHLSNGVILDFSKDSNVVAAPDTANVVKALRCCAEQGGCDECPFNSNGTECGEMLGKVAADLIENFILNKKFHSGDLQ